MSPKRLNIKGYNEIIQNGIEYITNIARNLPRITCDVEIGSEYKS